MIWYEYLRAEPAIYESCKADLERLRTARLHELQQAKTWDDTLRCQGRISELDGLLRYITHQEREEQHRAERERATS